jgi:hypothetical protein
MSEKDRKVLLDLLSCCLAWEPQVCVMGNVTAGDAADALANVLDPADQRAAFIAHFTPLEPLWTFQDDGTGGFHNQCTEWAWIGWQAALSAKRERSCETCKHGQGEPGIECFECEPTLDRWTPVATPTTHQISGSNSSSNSFDAAGVKGAGYQVSCGQTPMDRKP